MLKENYIPMPSHQELCICLYSYAVLSGVDYRRAKLIEFFFFYNLTTNIFLSPTVRSRTVNPSSCQPPTYSGIFPLIIQPKTDECQTKNKKKTLSSKLHQIFPNVNDQPFWNRFSYPQTFHQLDSSKALSISTPISQIPSNWTYQN